VNSVNSQISPVPTYGLLLLLVLCHPFSDEFFFLKSNVTSCYVKPQKMRIEVCRCCDSTISEGLQHVLDDQFDNGFGWRT